MLRFGETKYYIKFCLKNPHTWAGLLLYVLGRFNLKVREKLHAIMGSDGRLFHYPDKIRGEVKKISILSCPNKDWLEHIPSTGWLTGGGPKIEFWPIPLATYSLNFKDLDWFRNEMDKEDAFALHRFVWLLRWLSLRPAREHLEASDAIILDWIRRVRPHTNPNAWETYSASERVVNWLLYLCATKEHRIREAKATQNIGASLLEHLNHISRHLEYYGRSCHNHILNNARALYIGGQILRLPQFVALARQLFRRHLPELVNEEGVLLESSSHYQLLLTRTMAEVLWVARVSGDASFANHLDDTVCSMVSCCCYIGSCCGDDIPNDFPRVGDISPDCPVSWFYPDYQCSDKTESWWGLWNPQVMPLQKGKPSPGCVSPGGSKGWKWIEDPTHHFKILIHVPQYSRVYPAAHGHMDFGSFLLYDNEGPVLVDRGRKSYNSDSISEYGVSAMAHNTTLINGLPLVPDCRGLFLSYKKCFIDGIKVTSKDMGAERKVSWQTDVLDRSGKSLKWTRDIFLSCEGMNIEEMLSNASRASLAVESYLHWAPGWEMHLEPNGSNPESCFFIIKDGRSYRLRIECSGAKCTVAWFKGKAASPLGWHFTDYGTQVPALTLQLVLQCSGDYKLKFAVCPV
ncbi:MAG: heparinase II/III-family protein [Desulfobacterales bacterium]|nr:heparinase II/III-family protein [Desulfobacterales bacterium]